MTNLPGTQAEHARRIGLSAALIIRIALLAGIAWIAGLTAPIAIIFGFAFSWQDTLMLSGGMFLLWKSTKEIHNAVEGEEHQNCSSGEMTFTSVVAQIIILDLVFSIDSVITAIGMARHSPVMTAAVVTTMAIVLLVSGTISTFIEHHPTTKMLALHFLLLVGAALVADRTYFHILRGFFYFAIVFLAGVEASNLIAARRRGQQTGSKTQKGLFLRHHSSAGRAEDGFPWLMDRLHGGGRGTRVHALH